MPSLQDLQLERWDCFWCFKEFTSMLSLVQSGLRVDFKIHVIWPNDLQLACVQGSEVGHTSSNHILSDGWVCRERFCTKPHSFSKGLSCSAGRQERSCSLPSSVILPILFHYWRLVTGLGVVYSMYVLHFTFAPPAPRSKTEITSSIKLIDWLYCMIWFMCSFSFFLNRHLAS